MVAITESGKRLVGHIAKRQAITNAENTVYAAKRLIGRKWSSPQVKNADRDVDAYRIVEGPHDDVRIVLRDKVFSVPEISAMILQEMKLIAEDYLGEPVAEGGRHRAGVLQRRPAPGDQGRRPDRRARRHPHHQRADRGGARLRLRHATSSARSRSTTSAAARSTSRSSRSATASSRSSRPPATRSSAARTSTRASSTGSCSGFEKEHEHRPAPGPHGAAAPEGRRREGQVRALERARDRDQPAVHHLDAAATRRCTCSARSRATSSRS